MKKLKVIVFMLILLGPANTFARQGCCSRHGGVAGCTSYGRTICADGSLSPSCTCTPPAIYGCTDSKATNYNSNANRDNGTCKYDVKGCIDKKAMNYDSKANTSDGSCLYESKEILEEAIPFEIEYENIEEISEIEETAIIEEEIVQEGTDGLKKITIKKITDEKGQVISNEIVNEEIATEPKTKIVRIIKKEETPTTDEKEEEQVDHDQFLKDEEIKKEPLENIPNKKDKPKNSYLIYCIFAFALILKKHNSHTIVNKIKKVNNTSWKLILYFLYFITGIPVVIDIIIIIISFFNKKH